jgi:AraC-like DNA-binding protein
MEQGLRRRRFTGFDEYIQSTQGVNHEAIQLTRGTLSLNSEALLTDGFTLTRLHFNRDALVRAARHEGWYGIIVDLTPKTWCGVVVAPGTLRAIAPRREMTTISHGTWGSISINVRRDILAGWSPRVADLLDHDRGVEQSRIDADNAALEQFTTWVDGLFREPAAVSADGEVSLWMTALRDRAGQLAMKMFGDSPSPFPVAVTERIARYDLVMAALEIIHRNDDGRLSVKDLTTALGIGSRALEYAFAMVVGHSPSQYLIAARLTRARGRLRAGNSVTTVAFDHQFENLSRFAHQYTRLFGELPSSTLRDAREAMRKN